MTIGIPISPWILISDAKTAFLNPSQRLQTRQERNLNFSGYPIPIEKEL